MKVLHLTAGNLYGGIETFLVTLARSRYLCPGVEPHYGLCFPGRLRDELLAAGVPVHDLGGVRLSRPWTVWQARRRLRRLLSAMPCAAAVVHGSWPHVVFGPVVRRTGMRLVYMAHDAISRRHWLNRWAARTRPDAVIANSHFTASASRQVFPDVPTSIIHLPVPPPSLDPDRAVLRRTVREQIGTDADAVVIVQASRLERWKGQSVHLEALGRLRNLVGWEAWFAGGPQKTDEAEYLAELRQRTDELGLTGRVRFLGQRRDVPALLAAADIYCQPNTGPEPFGIAFVEALYAGLPVVTSHIGGGAEIVTPDCGIMCPPGDVVAVAEALRVLITDPPRRHALGSAGPARAAALCAPSRQIRAWAEAVLGVSEQPCRVSA